MAGGAGGEQPAPAQPNRLRRLVLWWQQALRGDGQERHTALLVGKGTLAATLAWVVSDRLLHAESPAFAPFSAVLIMQVTIYQSLVQSLRYVGAVVSGVAVQAAMAFLVGPEVATFALVALITLAIGRWPPLGVQGTQVSTAAFFAFSSYTAATAQSEKVSRLGEIVLLVLVGCVTGVVVNLVVMPPMRYRSAEYAIRVLAQALGSLFRDMHPALSAGELDEERTRRWRTQSSQALELTAQARAGMRMAQESLYYNPRRLARRHRDRSGFEGYGSVLDALERTLRQAASLTRSLDSWREEEDRYDYRRFLQCYGSFLESLLEITQVLGALDEKLLSDQSHQLRRLADQAQRCRRLVAQQAQEDGLPLADPTRPYGVLVVEATRLMEEFQHTSDVLKQHVP